MVWDCMSAAGVGPLVGLRLEGAVNAQRYRDLIIADTMLRFAHHHLPANFIFQHDNAPCHTARIVKQWLEQHGIRTLQWPAQSPDLSPIENLWRILKVRVAKHRPQTLDALWQAVQLEWRDISPDLCIKLVASRPRRCAAVLVIQQSRPTNCDFLIADIRSSSFLACLHCRTEIFYLLFKTWLQILFIMK